MKNHMIFRSKFLSRAFFAISLIGLLTTHGNSQTTTSLTLRLRVVDKQGSVIPGATVALNRQGTDVEMTGVTTEDGSVTFANLEPGTNKVTVNVTGFATLEKSVTVDANEDNDFTLAIAPTLPKAVQLGYPCGGAVPCLKDKINSLWLPISWRIARLLQYDYKLNEQPGTVLVGTEFIKNPQDNFHQHTITWKFAELFPDRLSMFKRGSDYLKKNPEAAGPAGDRELARLICDDVPLITCMTKGGNWFKRALLGTTISATLAQRSLVQQQILIEPTFRKKNQFAGGFTFDPAKLFPSVSNWRGMLDEVQRIDKALALIGARDVREGKRPWEHRWSVIFPKVDFKILTQFDFVKSGGVLVEAPFPERALNTWTFSWDLTRLIPDTKNRIDEDAIYETLDVLKGTLGKSDGWKKRCVVRIAGELTPRIIKDLHPGFSADSCQELAQIMLAQTYQLSCIKEGSPNDDGNAVAPSVAPARTGNNYCKW